MAAAAARESSTAESTRFLDESFPLPTQQALKNQIRAVISSSTQKRLPQTLSVFHEIASYITTLRSEISTLQQKSAQLQQQLQSQSQQQRPGGFTSTNNPATSQLQSQNSLFTPSNAGNGFSAFKDGRGASGGEGDVIMRDGGGEEEEDSGGSSSKKRKFSNGAGSGLQQQQLQFQPREQFPIHLGKLGAAKNVGGQEVGGEVLLVVKDISFSIPQRKKFTLEVTREGVLAVSATGGADGGRKVEWSCRWRDIKTAILLPVPEKAVRQQNLVIFPLGSEGLESTTTTITTAPLPIPEPCVLTLPDTPPKTASGSHLSTLPPDSPHLQTYTALLLSVFNAHLPRPVTLPSKSEFHSAIPQPHRKGEAAFHVKAHVGSKDGYLWFLPAGVLWGFKKPLMWIEFVRVESVSYTSITKRTFNLNVALHGGGGDGGEGGSGNPMAAEGEEATKGQGQEVEFAMIDQAEYTGIDMYVRKHRLNDKSMSEMRRAVFYDVNKTGGDDEGEDGQGGKGGPGGADKASAMSELEKALEEAEDAEEEDYDPDAEGEGGSSDGSGGSSDEDDSGSDGEGGGSDSEDGGDGDSDSDVGSVNLEDELGSELEEVPAESDEEMGGVARKIAARRRRG